jgi:N-acylneuraminate cytidylyltransferase
MSEDHGGRAHTETDRVWAVIPARGGSKGVPRKNLALVGNVPLISRAIRSCLASSQITDTVVTTDDPNIAIVSEREGAIVVRRPPALASDRSSSESAVLHALETVAGGAGRPLPAVTLLVQCTSPFIGTTELDAVVQEIREGRCDSCFTAIRTHRFLWKQDPGGGAVALNHDARHRLPRQSLEAQYMESGAVYGFRSDLFTEHGSRFVGRVGIIEVREQQGIEIDEPADLDVANALAGVQRIAATDPQRRQIPANLRALVMDFDGVMTDDRVFVDENGVEAVAVSRRDGLGLARLRHETDLQLLVLSTEVNPVVQRRCEKLRVPCLSGVSHKDEVLRLWLKEREMDTSECAYIGNDVNDLAAMELAGWSIAPADAHPVVLKTADMVLAERGGRGALRELCDILVAHCSSLVPAGGNGSGRDVTSVQENRLQS